MSGSEVELHPVAPAMTTWLAAPAGVILCSLQLLPDRSYRPNNGTGQTDRDS